MSEVVTHDALNLLKANHREVEDLPDQYGIVKETRMVLPGIQGCLDFRLLPHSISASLNCPGSMRQVELDEKAPQPTLLRRDMGMYVQAG